MMSKKKNDHNSFNFQKIDLKLHHMIIQDNIYFIHDSFKVKVNILKTNETLYKCMKIHKSIERVLRLQNEHHTREYVKYQDLIKTMHENMHQEIIAKIAKL